MNGFEINQLCVAGLLFEVENGDKTSKQEIQIEEGKFLIKTSCSSEASQLHFILHAKVPCCVYYLKVYNAQGEKIENHILSDQKVGEFCYLDQKTDASYLIKLREKKLQSIQITGYLLPLFDTNFFYEFSRSKQIEKRYRRLEKQYKQSISELYQVSNDKRELEVAYDAMIHSFFWRLTKPLRALSTGIKRLLKATPLTNMVLRIFSCFREKGFRFTIKKCFRRIVGQDKSEKTGKILSYHLPKGEWKQQRKTEFSLLNEYDILIYVGSEIKKEELIACIDSIEKQSYTGWNLYIAVSQKAASNAEIEQIIEQTEKNQRVYWLQNWDGDKVSAINAMLARSEGNYKILMEAKDLLHPSALFECQKVLEAERFELLYTDEASFDGAPEAPFDYHFKPDYAPITLRGHNYINHMLVVSTELWRKTGLLDSVLDEESHYDWILRLIEQDPSILHISKALYYNRRKKEAGVTEVQAQRMQKALQAHLNRLEIKADVIRLAKAGTFKVKYAIQGEPLISILIPNKDYVNDLSNCIQSIMEKSTYRNFEIIIIENNSTKQETFEYYEEVQKEYSQIRVVYWEGIFNYSGINNYGAQFAKGEYLVLLNNDVEIITPEWLEEMLMFAQMPQTGAVGAMLYYPDDTVQHAGVTIGVQGVGGHAHKEFKRGSEGYHNRMLVAQNLSCVTAACMMLPRKIFDQVEGLDERFEVAFNDVDLCLKILKANHNIIFTPFAELYHFESKSRGTDETPVKRKRFVREVMLFTQEWKPFLDKGDPFYNPNLTLEANDFSYKN